VSASDYSKGLRHGREDLAKLIGEALAENTDDAGKLQRIAWLIAPLVGGAVVELPDSPEDRGE
jgi:imidazoleglycerol phosphate dehydratase HisB